MNSISPVRKRILSHPNSHYPSRTLSALTWLGDPFSLLIAALLLIPPTTAHAETITVGRGEGVLWQGLNFNQSVLATNRDSTLHSTGGIAVISNVTTGCILVSQLTLINGVYAYPIAPGIGLTPDATVSGYVIGPDPSRIDLNGTIGLRGTQGTFVDAGNAVIPREKQWCLTIQSADFYPNSAQNITIRGSWAIIADGTQTSGEYDLPPMYAGTFTTASEETKPILSAGNTLRVNTLVCTIDTPSDVNFGNVLRDTTPNAELATRDSSLRVNCDQRPGGISSNVTISFLYKTALYNGEATKLAVEPSGAYITGEISDGITGSGLCESSTGVPFNNTPIGIGTMPAEYTNYIFAHQITWRLCSGGSELPSGPINASAELQVTFN